MKWEDVTECIITGRGENSQTHDENTVDVTVNKYKRNSEFFYDSYNLSKSYRNLQIEHN
jgi:hypothetical protein